MATSFLRPDDAQRAHRRLTTPPRRRLGPGRLVALGVVVIVAVLAVLAVLFATSKASLSSDGSALARIGLPLGGGTIQSVSVDVGPQGTPVPATVKGDPTIWPNRAIPAHSIVHVYVTVRRPGWISWLTGKTERLQLTLRAPSATLRNHYVTLGRTEPLVLHFKQGIRAIAYGTAGHMTRRTFATPVTRVTVPHTGTAGTVTVNAKLRTWESAKDTDVSFFPAGSGATAVAVPSPGTRLTPHTTITLTFNKPVSKALGANLPSVSPVGAGTWHRLNSHAIRFVPSGYGYGLGANVTIPLPSGVHLVGATAGSGQTVGTWSVPGGSTLREQQLLAMLGYLPFHFSYANGKGVADTPQAQEAAAITAPAGRFTWAYPNIPGALHNMWSPGASGTMTEGALMAFENDHDMYGTYPSQAQIWKALITAIDANKRSTFGYTFVTVSEGSPESETTWHNGKTVASGPVNTGVASTPTATGVYPVFEHLPVTTMSGTNPDGSHYDDPGIKWVSYFNGGDALHEFPRGSYGFPQSDGCVEMPEAEAASVYPYTPIGTLVDVT